MNYIGNTNFSFLIAYAIWGIIAFFTFRIIKFYAFPIDSNKKREVTRTWKTFTIVFWTIFFGSIIYKAYRSDIIITATAIGIIYTVGWNYWRNIFSGILIHFSNEYQVGELISADDFEGELSAINTSQSELINENGEKVIIPNYKLKSSIVVKLPKKKNATYYTFDVKNTNIVSIEEIKKSAFNCPYISSNQKIEIDKTDSHYSIKAAIIDPSLRSKVDQYFIKLASD